MKHDNQMRPVKKKIEEVGSFKTESYYVKKSDGFVYYYWRIVGSDTWNMQKTGMARVPTAKMVMDIRKKALEQTPPKTLLEERTDDE